MKNSTKQELRTAALVLSLFAFTGVIVLGFCWLLSMWAVEVLLICAVLLILIALFGDKARKWREEEEMIYKSVKNN